MSQVYSCLNKDMILNGLLKKKTKLGAKLEVPTADQEHEQKSNSQYILARAVNRLVCWVMGQLPIDDAL